MATEFNGMPFSYNPAITNVNVDNQLAMILAKFNDDYILDVVQDSIENRFRIYSPPRPNIVAAYENNFKELTDGFSSNFDEIQSTRQRVYINIINTICAYYGFSFNQDLVNDDLYSAAYWLYDFLVSGFTEKIKTFYSIYLIKERYSIDSALGLTQKKENSNTLSYSKRLFKDPALAAIHCDLDYVVRQMSTFNIDLPTILNCVYMSNPTVPPYIASLIVDNTGSFFNNHYHYIVTESPDAVDILTYIKLSLQQIGGEIESES